MPVGTVKFFNTQRGFGFIVPDDGSSDVFVHVSAVEQAGMRAPCTRGNAFRSNWSLIRGAVRQTPRT